MCGWENERSVSNSWMQVRFGSKMPGAFSMVALDWTRFVFARTTDRLHLLTADVGFTAAGSHHAK